MSDVDLSERGSIIYVEGITVDFDGFKALRTLNFFVDYHELRVVIGPNGAGKTTLLDVISGKVKPVSGRVVFGKDTDLIGLREHEIASLGIGRKFQTPSVYTNLTVWENLDLSLRRKSRGVVATLMSKSSPSENGQIADTLDTIGLAQKANARAGALSHGEKQWLEIAMVLLQDPALLLIDEPVAGMTNQETEQTGLLLESLVDRHSIIVIEHDMEFVRQIARTVTVLHEGTVLCEGPVERIQADPRVVEIYLGRQKEADAAAR
ncbi:urea ABC transporter ATP-binding protein UrtD [Nitrospiraceae bacterium AH_259_D15_M11_P09]|nr:urea ABC transporter ATP-binding protein UrtD [Nitrospiraceae bacterium AH_259_D15_M11_P09]